MRAAVDRRRRRSRSRGRRGRARGRPRSRGRRRSGACRTRGRAREASKCTLRGVLVQARGEHVVGSSIVMPPGWSMRCTGGEVFPDASALAGGGGSSAAPQERRHGQARGIDHARQGRDHDGWRGPPASRFSTITQRAQVRTSRAVLVEASRAHVDHAALAVGGLAQPDHLALARERVAARRPAPGSARRHSPGWRPRCTRCRGRSCRTRRGRRGSVERCRGKPRSWPPDPGAVTAARDPVSPM